MPINSAQVDEIDTTLLQLLQQDSRTTIRSLAESVGLSPSGCLRRIQLLEERGVISSYGARLNPEAVGLGMRAFIRVSLAKNDRPALDAFLADVDRWPEVLACYATTGDADYLLHVIGPDLSALRDYVMNRLTAHPAVANVNTSVVLEVAKTTEHLPLQHLSAEPAA